MRIRIVVLILQSVSIVPEAIILHLFSVVFHEVISVFSPNIGKHRPEKTPYLDNFHATQTFTSDVMLGNASHILLFLM